MFTQFRNNIRARSKYQKTTHKSFHYQDHRYEWLPNSSERLVLAREPIEWPTEAFGWPLISSVETRLMLLLRADYVIWSTTDATLATTKTTTTSGYLLFIDDRCRSSAQLTHFLTTEKSIFCSVCEQCKTFNNIDRWKLICFTLTLSDSVCNSYQIWINQIDATVLHLLVAVQSSGVEHWRPRSNWTNHRCMMNAPRLVGDRQIWSNFMRK